MGEIYPMIPCTPTSREGRQLEFGCGFQEVIEKFILRLCRVFFDHVTG